MKSTREILTEVGGQHVAKGVEKGLQALDAKLGKANEVFYKKPSFWIRLALAGLCIYASTKVREPYDQTLLAKGVHYTTTFWDDLETFFSK